MKFKIHFQSHTSHISYVGSGYCIGQHTIQKIFIIAKSSKSSLIVETFLNFCIPYHKTQSQLHLFCQCTVYTHLVEFGKWLNTQLFFFPFWFLIFKIFIYSHFLPAIIFCCKQVAVASLSVLLFGQYSVRGLESGSQTM